MSEFVKGILLGAGGLALLEAAAAIALYFLLRNLRITG